MSDGKQTGNRSSSRVPSLPTRLGKNAPIEELAGEKGFFAEILDNFATVINPQKNDECLDVGCGYGSLVRRLSLACYLSIGVDEDLSAVLRAKEICWNAHITNVQFYHSSLDDMPFKTPRFHRAAVVNLLYRRAEPESVIAGLARVTRPGGKLFALEPSPLMTSESMINFIRQQGVTGYAAQFMEQLAQDVEKKTPLSADKLEQLFGAHGFKALNHRELMNGLIYVVEGIRE